MLFIEAKQMNKDKMRKVYHSFEAQKFGSSLLAINMNYETLWFNGIS